MACSRVNLIFLHYVHSGKKDLRCFALTMKAYRENGHIAALILNHVTRWGKKTSSSLAALCQGKELPITIHCEAGWTPEVMWTFRRRDKCLAQPGVKSLIIQPVA